MPPPAVLPLPAKLFFRIGEVAGLVGVEPHVLRYWEREFRAIRPSKSSKGQRVYSRRDVENLLRVRALLYEEGFTIAGAKKRLAKGGEPEPTPEAHKAVESAPTPAPTPPTPTAAAAPPRVEPARRPPVALDSDRIRASLHELRNEVEALLAELESG